MNSGSGGGSLGTAGSWCTFAASCGAALGIADGLIVGSDAAS
mgnify:FL=1